MVIDDVRFANEAAAIREMGGIPIRVNGPGVVASCHVSETEQAGIAVDYELANVGTIADLVHRVAAILSLHGQAQVA